MKIFKKSQIGLSIDQSGSMSNKPSVIDIDKNGKVTMNGQTFSVDDIHLITPLDEEFLAYYENRITKKDFGPHPEKFEKLAKVRFERFTSPMNEKYKALIDRWISTFGFPDRYMLKYANDVMQNQLMPTNWLVGFVNAVERNINLLDVTGGILNSHDPDWITQTQRMIISFGHMLVSNIAPNDLKDRMEKLVLTIVDRYGATFIGTMWMQKKLADGYELSDEAKEKTIRRTINGSELPLFIREYMENMKNGPYSGFFKEITDKYVKAKYGFILEPMYEYCKGLSDRMQIPEDWEYSLNMGVKSTGMIHKWATNWGCKKIESKNFDKSWLDSKYLNYEKITNEDGDDDLAIGNIEFKMDKEQMEWVKKLLEYKCQLHDEKISEYYKNTEKPEEEHKEGDEGDNPHLKLSGAKYKIYKYQNSENSYDHLAIVNVAYTLYLDCDVEKAMQIAENNPDLFTKSFSQAKSIEIAQNYLHSNSEKQIENTLLKDAILTYMRVKGRTPKFAYSYIKHLDEYDIPEDMLKNAFNIAKLANEDDDLDPLIAKIKNFTYSSVPRIIVDMLASYLRIGILIKAFANLTIDLIEHGKFERDVLKNFLEERVLKNNFASFTEDLSIWLLTELENKSELMPLIVRAIDISFRNGNQPQPWTKRYIQDALASGDVPELWMEANTQNIIEHGIPFQFFLSFSAKLLREDKYPEIWLEHGRPSRQDEGKEWNEELFNAYNRKHNTKINDYYAKQPIEEEKEDEGNPHLRLSDFKWSEEEKKISDKFVSLYRNTKDRGINIDPGFMISFCSMLEDGGISTDLKNEIFQDYMNGSNVSDLIGIEQSYIENFVKKEINNKTAPEWFYQEVMNSVKRSGWAWECADEYLIDYFKENDLNSPEMSQYRKAIEDYIVEYDSPPNFAIRWCHDNVRDNIIIQESIYRYISKTGIPCQWQFKWAKDKLESGNYPKEWETSCFKQIPTSGSDNEESLAMIWQELIAKKITQEKTRNDSENINKFYKQNDVPETENEEINPHLRLASVNLNRLQDINADSLQEIASALLAIVDPTNEQLVNQIQKLTDSENSNNPSGKLIDWLFETNMLVHGELGALTIVLGQYQSNKFLTQNLLNGNAPEWVYKEIYADLASIGICKQMFANKYIESCDYDSPQMKDIAEAFMIYFQNHGFFPESANKWLEKEINNNAFIQDFVTKKISDVGFPNDRWMFDWAKNKLESGNYPKEWETSCFKHMRIDEDSNDDSMNDSDEYELCSEWRILVTEEIHIKGHNNNINNYYKEKEELEQEENTEENPHLRLSKIIAK